MGVISKEEETKALVFCPWPSLDPVLKQKVQHELFHTITSMCRRGCAVALPPINEIEG